MTQRKGPVIIQPHPKSPTVCNDGAYARRRPKTPALLRIGADLPNAADLGRDSQTKRLHRPRPFGSFLSRCVQRCSPVCSRTPHIFLPSGS